MTERTSLRLQGQWAEASAKFDYFVLGVAIALIGYLGPSLDLESVRWWSACAELGSLVFFMASAYAGFKRIECSVQFLSKNYNKLFLEEEGALVSRARLEGMVAETMGLTLPPNSPASVTVEDLLRRVSRDLQQQLNDLGDDSMRWYHRRNRALGCGLTLLVLARILPA